jgi:ketosteroid isomerase-like protein
VRTQPVKALVAVAAVLAAAAAFAADLTPEQIIRRHVEAANRGDVAAMAADYAENAVILEPGRTVHGRAAIQSMFGGVFGSAAPAKFTVTPTRIWSDGDVGFITWTANAGRFQGSDTYLVRNGKILVQAVFIGAVPPSAR